jgi:hypothetical protein
MNPHTPKGASTLRVGVLMDSRIFKERLQGSKLNELKSFYIIENLLECRCLKWARMTHLDTSNMNYGQKKATNSLESPRFPHVQMACNIPLERSQ